MVMVEFKNDRMRSTTKTRRHVMAALAWAIQFLRIYHHRAKNVPAQGLKVNFEF